MKNIFLPELLSRDLINESGYYSHNITLRPVIFEDTDEKTKQVKQMNYFALSVSKLSWKDGNRTVRHKGYIDKNGEAKSRPETTTIYLPPELIAWFQASFSEIDLDSVSFTKSK